MDTLILNTTAQRGGVDYDQDLSYDFEKEIAKMVFCKKSYIKTYEEVSGAFCFHPITCNKFWCPDCGGNGGKIHRKRKRKLYDRVDFESEVFRQLIFTVPEDLRGSFMSRDMINKFGAVVKNCVQKYFPDRRLVAYFHIHGDKSNFRFHPHWNVHVIENRGTVLKIPQAMLDEIKESYVRGMRGLLGIEGIKRLDVHYSFKDGIIKMKHAVKYMSRPIDDRVLESGNNDLKALCVLELKGFRYIRDWGKKEKGKSFRPINDNEIYDRSRFRFLGIVKADEMEAMLNSSDSILVERDDGAFEMRPRWKPRSHLVGVGVAA